MLGDGVKYALCGPISSDPNGHIDRIDILGKIRQLTNNALVASKYVNHPCVQFWLNVGKQYEVLSIESMRPNPIINPDYFSPFFKLGMLHGIFEDPKSRVYRIYAPIYTAGLSRLAIYFKGRIAVYFVDLPKDAQPPLVSMFALFDKYWHDRYWRPLISTSGGSAFSDERIILTIPKTYRGIAPLVIEYAPYNYTKSEIMMSIVTPDTHCTTADPFNPIKKYCYNYDCMREEVATVLYEVGIIYEEGLIVSLVDGDRSYIPTIRGSFVFETPKEPVAGYYHPLGPYIAETRYWYPSVVSNIYRGGGHVDKSVGRVPHILTNPRYEFITRML
jgi:hypothetical protein